MKNLLLSLVAGLLSTGQIAAQSLTFTTNPTTGCHNGGWTFGQAGVTSTVSGATSYSWSISHPSCSAQYSQAVVGMSIINVYYPCPGTYTLNVFAMNGSTVLTSATGTVVLTPSVQLSGSGNTLVCPGSPVTFTMGGATSYTWMPGNSSGSSVTFSPVSNTTYTVYGTNGGGCIASLVLTANVSNGTVSLSGATGTVCSGNSGIIHATGAASYSWSPAPSQTFNNGASAVYNPGSTTCYTVYGSTGGTCTPSSVVHCMTVVPSPSISVSGNTNVCMGQNASFTVTGASTYSWIGGSLSSTYMYGTGSVAAFSPNVSGTHTMYVAGYNTNGCMASQVFTFNVNTAGSLSTGASPGNIICAGSSATLTATGGNSYTWNPGNLTGSMVVVSPTASTVYQVAGSQTAGCNSIGSVTVVVLQAVQAYASSNNLCPGQTVTLSTQGAWSSHVWTHNSSTISTSPVAVVNPTASGCYMVNAAHAAGCTLSGTVCVSVFPFTFSVTSNPSTICSGGSSWLMPWVGNPSLYSFTWTPGSINQQSILVSPSVTTCYTVAVTNNSTGCTGTGVTCVSVTPTPTITVSGNQTVCAGTVLNLTASGAGSYTWNSGNTWGGGSSFSIVPSANQQTFSVVSYSNGCYFGAWGSFTVSPSPSVSIVGTSSVCPGAAAVLYGFGAANYTWLPSQVNSSSITVNPASTTTYTLTGANSSGCTSSATKVVYMYPVPNVAVTGNNNICLGGTTTLTASGASSYTWNTGQNTNPIIVSPSVSTCYSVIGTSANGCTAMAASCVSVQSTSLVISPVTPTVCKWSSVTLTVSGASTYTWSTSANTSTLNVIPLVSTGYTVTGTGSNGCIGIATVTVAVDTTCSMVWPGDANSDGVVSSSDVLELGFAANATGAARSGASNNYVAQFANNWSGTVSSGKNKCHADCNGNGAVNANDTVAIFNNFSLTHSFRLSASSGPADIYLVSNSFNVVNPGWNSLDIMLGDSTASVDLYGLVFDLGFDQSVIESGDAYISYTSSFLNNGNANIEFRKPALNNGVIYAASVRTDQSEVNGYGKIGEFHFKVKDGLAESTVLPVGITNAMKAKADRSFNTLSGHTLLLAMNSDPVGVSGLPQQGTISAYPNPASEWLTLKAAGTQQVQYSIADVTGRLIREGSFRGAVSIPASDIENGTYIIIFKTGDKQQSQKLIIQR